MLFPCFSSPQPLTTNTTTNSSSSVSCSDHGVLSPPSFEHCHCDTHFVSVQCANNQTECCYYQYNRVRLLFITFLFGVFGTHYFVLGKIVQGVATLILFLCSLVASYFYLTKKQVVDHVQYQLEMHREEEMRPKDENDLVREQNAHKEVERYNMLAQLCFLSLFIWLFIFNTFLLCNTTIRDANNVAIQYW